MTFLCKSAVLKIQLEHWKSHINHCSKFPVQAERHGRGGDYPRSLQSRDWIGRGNPRARQNGPAASRASRRPGLRSQVSGDSARVSDHHSWFRVADSAWRLRLRVSGRELCSARTEPPLVCRQVELGLSLCRASQVIFCPWVLESSNLFDSLTLGIVGPCVKSRFDFIQGLFLKI